MVIFGLEVAGIPLTEVDALSLTCPQPMARQARLAILHQFTLQRNGVAETVLTGEGQRHIDEAGRVVHPVHMLEVAGQFEAGAAGGAADIQRPLVVAAQLAGKFGKRLGVVGYPEVARAVLEVEVLSDQRVGFIGIHDNGFLITGDQIAETRMLEEVTPEGVTG